MWHNAGQLFSASEIFEILCEIYFGFFQTVLPCTIYFMISKRSAIISVNARNLGHTFWIIGLQYVCSFYRLWVVVYKFEKIQVGQFQAKIQYVGLHAVRQTWIGYEAYKVMKVPDQLIQAPASRPTSPSGFALTPQAFNFKFKSIFSMYLDQSTVHLPISHRKYPLKDSNSLTTSFCIKGGWPR